MAMTTMLTLADALAAAGGAGAGDFAAGATELLAALGYRSELILGWQSGDAGDLFRQLPEPLVPGTQSEQDFVGEAQSVHILFQLTDAEIAAAVESPGQGRFDGGGFDGGNAESFLFAAVELRGDAYPRSQYAAFTREINKRIQVPTVVLFRTAGQSDGGGRITLAFVHRRPNRYDPDRDVLGSVSLIREIDPVNPHRAHLDILGQLALPARLEWMDWHGKSRNFDGLLDAWLAALDTETLNRRFYAELFEWFERAVAVARFPTGEKVTRPPEEHIIRLITRLLFVWFLKEKGLVAGELFAEHRAAQLLKDYDREGGDSYYRAILQNLFFATLNTPVEQRGFSSGQQTTHRLFSYYRYAGQLADADGLMALLARTPFVNGGLFDCLDSEAGTRAGGYRVDCFSDVHYGKLSIPNRLFFGDGDGDAANPNNLANAGRPAHPIKPGLIDLFNRYQFTVVENTPADQEVALDPELLGKVFENLLATINEETSVTARKETGAYYTPRPVVDYMVDEALAAALSVKAAPAGGDGGASGASDTDTNADTDTDARAERIRRLLDYDDALADADTLFDTAERERIVGAIAGLKALDPAVGSGAFPMSILHKLTLALRRLDPKNHSWERVQQEQAVARAGAAFGTADQAARDAELVEISAIFERYRDSDYGRKLYLIQNCIYGVDIQPIAVQIAKLRFFISLAIEQEPDAAAGAADNYGIKPLPNLETRLVAADTLLPLAQSAQLPMHTKSVTELERAIAANRERHFHATTRDAKNECRDRDRDLRQQLAEALEADGFPAQSAGQLAAWDPFDQNAGAADWFDAKYMFGVDVAGGGGDGDRDGAGFDVVIGNPPYIQLQKEGGRLGRRYRDAGFATYARTGDVYQLFYEKGGQLLKPQRGILAYITSNSWLKAEYGKATRRYLAERHTPRRLLEMGQDVFEQAIVDSSILVLSGGPPAGSDAAPGRAVDVDKVSGADDGDGRFPPAAHLWSDFRPPGERPWSLLTPAEQAVLDTMERVGTPLRDWDVSIYRGVTTGLNAAFIIDDDTRQRLIAADPKSAEIIKPIVRGRDIRRWHLRRAGLYLIYARKGIAISDYPAVHQHLLEHYDALAKKSGSNEWYELQASPSDQIDVVMNGEKLVWLDLVENGRFAYDDSGLYCEATTFAMAGQDLKYLCGVLNSRLIRWYLQQIAPTSGMGVFRWKKVYVERIPIPRATAADRRRVAGLVDGILGAGSAARVAELEGELDAVVGGLYGLEWGEVVGVVGY